LSNEKKVGPEENLEQFLDVEFLHSLGCYREASEKASQFTLGAIAGAGGALRRTRDLNELLDRARDDAEEKVRHPNPQIDPSPNGRGEQDEGSHPPDHEFELLLDTEESRHRLRQITDFYRTGVAALDAMLDSGPDRKEPPEKALEELGTCLFWDREPASSFRAVNRSFRKRLAIPRQEGRHQVPLAPSVRSRMEGKRERFLDRLTAVEAALKPQLTHRGEWGEDLAAKHAATLLKTDLESRPNEQRGDITPGFVLQCLVAAHLRLHYVEYFLAYPFERAMTISAVAVEETLQRLREAESLNTFVYVISRSMPWLFAADAAERKAAIRTCQDGFGAGLDENPSTPPDVDPTVFRALWRSQRVSFLALHRRAFGHSLRDALVDEGFNDTSFKDFHKLQRLLRVQRRVLEHLDEAKVEYPRFRPLDFVLGIDALAETHTGDLYRSDHAHPVALKHFCDAFDRLNQLSKHLREGEEPDPAESKPFGEIEEGPHKVASSLQDSRWRIHLMMSKGKGFYESGNLKRSAKWLLKSWSALLVLIHHRQGGLRKVGPERDMSDEEQLEVFGVLSTAIEMLSGIKNDPDFSKEELASKVGPVIESAVTIEIPKGLGVIASEILLRLGHVLFVLRLDCDEVDQNTYEEKHELARMCLTRAEELDDASTLVLADQLKIAHRRGEDIDLDDLRYPKRQWPYGRGNPEQLIRVIEYHLLRWLAVHGDRSEETPGSAVAQDREVAQSLISGLLTHTDSINVRQSQVYRYLMQPKRPARRIGSTEGWQEPKPRNPLQGEDETAIEFVCLRRYSSFFPFVPRPSAFRSLGGGYLLRLHHQDDGCPNPFGIAVDPGPDFIENLYRCGFGLGDINMVILTHDHPDHSVELAPILSLMGYRMKHGDETFKAPDRRDPEGPVRRLLIVGNESVAKQLSFFNKPHVSERGAGNPSQMRPDSVQVVSFDEFDAFFRETMSVRERNQHPEVAIPDELRIQPVVSVRHPDGFGMLAYGFRLSLGDHGPSIGFTGDTGGFLLKLKEEEEGKKPWRIQPNDEHQTMKLSGDRTWREHWAPVLDSDVLIPHVSGLPLAQLLVLANEGKQGIDWGDDKDGKALAETLLTAWNGLEKEVRKQVSFAFWLPENNGKVSLPLEAIEDGTRWPKGHLYLIGLLEFARAYKLERERVDRPGLLLVGELREELGSLRGKIAGSLNDSIFDSSPSSPGAPSPGCRALTTDVGLRLMITREKGETQVRVLCSTCDLDNDRTRKERFHEPGEIREVCVKGENEGMFYNCSNHDPSRQTHPVFLERVERYDVFSAMPNP
jgi:hypothetical protein